MRQGACRGREGALVFWTVNLSVKLKARCATLHFFLAANADATELAACIFLLTAAATTLRLSLDNRH